MLLAKTHLSTLLASAYTFALQADPGPPIPAPKVPMQKAVNIARTVMLGESQDKQEVSFRSQMLTVDVRYESEWHLITNYPDKYPPKTHLPKNPRWYWIITFVHPVANDVSRTYCVDQSGKTQFLAATT